MVHAKPVQKMSEGPVQKMSECRRGGGGDSAWGRLGGKGRGTDFLNTLNMFLESGAQRTREKSTQVQPVCNGQVGYSVGGVCDEQVGYPQGVGGGGEVEEYNTI